jgi:hypothetical protein
VRPVFPELGRQPMVPGAASVPSRRDSRMTDRMMKAGSGMDRHRGLEAVSPGLGGMLICRGVAPDGVGTSARRSRSWSRAARPSSTAARSSSVSGMLAVIGVRHVVLSRELAVRGPGQAGGDHRWPVGARQDLPGQPSERGEGDHLVARRRQFGATAEPIQPDTPVTNMRVGDPVADGASMQLLLCGSMRVTMAPPLRHRRSCRSGRCRAGSRAESRSPRPVPACERRGSR